MYTQKIFCLQLHLQHCLKRSTASPQARGDSLWYCGSAAGFVTNVSGFDPGETSILELD
jgi:hypothetical protein